MQIHFLPSTAGDLAWMNRYYAKIFPAGAKQASKQYFKAKRILRDIPNI